MSISASYKPPHLYGSSPTRNSPFRRPESPVSPSPLRISTPTASPSKNTPGTNNLRTHRPGTAGSAQSSWTPKGPQSSDDVFVSPQRQMHSRTRSTQGMLNGNALSQLQAGQVRTLRDSFQILDRDCDGVVNRDDVGDMLQQLGLPAGPSDVAQFFPPSKPQTIALAAFLNSLAEALAALSPSNELLSAFSAFDDDDSGQIDWAELREALLNTPPEAGERPLTAAEVDMVVQGFTGRRAFNRNMNAQLAAKRGDVFKYQDFVSSIAGTQGTSESNGSQQEAGAV
ncbi:Putative EF-hand-like domain protein [[Torrubiella] hemipterigena]|uniref:Putative EF-hand-like domain protein n=1 Tax=[Torrubiella] hemipterigena TaxID=1531966 RepID=A0A0A1T6Q2_9HYPO|nr:Putative EF-hand-like domain protein [[Torrubiella] hemipterigena]